MTEGQAEEASGLSLLPVVEIFEVGNRVEVRWGAGGSKQTYSVQFLRCG